MEEKTTRELFEDIYKLMDEIKASCDSIQEDIFVEDGKTIDSGEYITVVQYPGDNRTFYSAKDQEWSKKAKEELWNKHKIIMNSGVVGVKVDKKLITLGIEDDGTVAFGDDSLCFNVYWVDSLIDALQEAKKRILEGE